MKVRVSTLLLLVVIAALLIDRWRLSRGLDEAVRWLRQGYSLGPPTPDLTEPDWARGRGL